MANTDPIYSRRLETNINDQVICQTEPVYPMSNILKNSPERMYLHRINDTSDRLQKNVIDNQPEYTQHNFRWNDKIEESVKMIGEESKGYKIMHIITARKTNTYYNILMFVGITLGPLSALLSGIGDTLNNNNPTFFSISSMCVGFFSGIIVAITKFGKYEEKSTSHKLAASKYTSLESNIRRQLILARQDRVNASNYLEWIGNSFDELFQASPLIDNKIYKEYVNIATKHGFVVPEEYGITINIDENYDNKKVNETDININKATIPIKMEPDIHKIEIKRSDTISRFPNIETFSDGQMIYEMKRMGFKS